MAEDTCDRRHSWVKRVVALIAAAFLATYVGSYVALSRRGFQEAKATDAPGFYFLPPEESDAWRAWNFGLVKFYYPLIVIDNWLGTGMPIASEPLWRLN